MSRLEEDEKNQADIRKRKFFAEILNAARESQLQAQAVLKRRKQRNDGIQVQIIFLLNSFLRLFLWELCYFDFEIFAFKFRHHHSFFSCFYMIDILIICNSLALQAWHARQRQRATRAEKLRFQALKADDQEAYMRMVEESKNERLTMLLTKTNELLVCLGAAVQRQKDADGLEAPKSLEFENLSKNSLSTSETPGEMSLDDDNDFVDADSSQNKKANDLLEGQRQYNSAVHSIQEKVWNKNFIFQSFFFLLLLTAVA